MRLDWIYSKNKFSGFTFVHNALHAGYPIVEAIAIVKQFVDEVVVVDMESDDGTSELLASFNVKTIPGKWANTAGEVLAENFLLNEECKNEGIIFFEADEVWQPSLVGQAMSEYLRHGGYVSVWRVQVEQNFQRIKWYPHPVTRVFPRGKAHKKGETLQEKATSLISNEYGFLWDISNCFKDQYIKRKHQMARWWNDSPPNLQFVPEHFLLDTQSDFDGMLNDKHWEFKSTPLNIPSHLRPLVGQKTYKPTKECLRICRR